MMDQTRRGLLIILSSPSGAGKSTLAKRLRSWDSSLEFSVSVTTRKPRPGEEDGREYHFVSEKAFKVMAQNDDLLEYAKVFGNWYGTPRTTIERGLRLGKDFIFDIDWQGAQQLQRRQVGVNVLSIFLLPPSIAALRERLQMRGQDDDETISDRMQKSWDEISHWDGYDYVLVNDDLDSTEERLRTIINAEKMRADRQPWLADFVRGLQSEFEDMP